MPRFDHPATARQATVSPMPRLDGHGWPAIAGGKRLTSGPGCVQDHAGQRAPRLRLIQHRDGRVDEAMNAARRQGENPELRTAASPAGRRLVTMSDRIDPALSATEMCGLVAAIAARQDRHAFAQLFAHFAPRVKTWLQRTGVTPTAAEELAQETMLLVWRKAAYFDAARGGASTWIFTIARNLRVDHQRRARRPEVPGLDASEEPVPPASAESIMLAAERETMVRTALAALSEEQSAIVRLSFFGDKPHADIARELGLPLGTVKSRIRLALNRLRGMLGDSS